MPTESLLPAVAAVSEQRPGSPRKTHHLLTRRILPRRASGCRGPGLPQTPNLHQWSQHLLCLPEREKVRHEWSPSPLRKTHLTLCQGHLTSIAVDTWYGSDLLHLPSVGSKAFSVSLSPTVLLKLPPHKCWKPSVSLLSPYQPSDKPSFIVCPPLWNASSTKVGMLLCCFILPNPSTDCQ